MIGLARNSARFESGRWPAAMVLSATALAMPVSGQVCQYDFTIVPEIDCAFGPNPPPITGMNNLGQAVGYCGAWEGEEALFWDGGSAWTVLPRPSWSSGARPEALNDLGDIVGHVRDARNSNLSRACMWKNDGEFVDLGLLQGANQSEALAINNSRQITGYSFNDITGLPFAAFLWQEGLMISLAPDLGNPVQSRGFDISESGEIAGSVGTFQNRIGFVWDNSKVITFGPVPGGTTSEGYAIIQSGVVAGRSLIEYDPKNGIAGFRALLWNGDSVIDLGALPGFNFSIAVDLNEQTVLGYCFPANPGSGDVVFVHQNGSMQRLEHLINSDVPFKFGYSRDINHEGQIAANGIMGVAPDWEQVNVLLTPVYSVGDVNHSCRTDVDDLLLLIQEWGQPDSVADINYDAAVDVFDLVLLLADWVDP